MRWLNQTTNRRDALKRLSGVAALSLGAPLIRGAESAPSRGKRLGVVVYSYHLRRSSQNSSTQYPPFKDAIELLEHCHSLGAGGAQVGVHGWQAAFGKRVRDRREQLGMFLEGQIRLPKSESDLSAFESDLLAAREAGATVLRVAVGGRRYEQFDNVEDFKAMKTQAWKSFRLAEPIAAKHRVKLGVENHKDWRIPEMLEFMEGLSSEWIGTCIDTGNSIALLESPMETVQAFAKYAVSTHIKDMAVKEYDEGFLLSEVPIGQGFLDMRRIFDICEKANPKIQFCLEMITRDPLRIPCLTNAYWATFESMKPQRLAQALSMVRDRQTDRALPRIADRGADDRLAYENRNVYDCIRYAETHLGLKG